MILGIVCIILGFLLAFAYNCMEDRMVNKISFFDTFDATGMPVVRFKCNDKDIRLLIDSGSDISYISPSAAKIMEDSETVRKRMKLTVVCGTGTTKSEVPEITLPITHGDVKFHEPFTIVEHLDNQFSQIREIKGITIHGIVGTSFLKKAKAVIDFNKCQLRINEKGNNIKRKRSKA